LRPTAVGAHAPSANRVNVRPARAGAEPELANLGRVSLWGARPFFLLFWGKLVAAEYAFAGVGGHFFAPALESDAGRGGGTF
jgi:hypothetical protein